MAEIDSFNSTPVGSLSLLASIERDRYFDRLFGLPKTLQGIAIDPRIGAFTRGLAKAYTLPVEKAAYIALTIMRVVVGEVKLSGLAAALAASVPLPLDQAEKMAREIERDLLAPVKEDLEKYWQERTKLVRQEQKKPVTQTQEKGLVLSRLPAVSRPKNVLDLKKGTTKLPPLPPRIPRP